MKDLGKWKDLRFNLTKNMNEMMIEMLITRQMLKENKLSKKDKKLLQDYLNELLAIFRLEFQKNNQEQIKMYYELMNK